MGKRSKYSIIEQPDGFRMEGADRTPVTVRLWPTYLEASYQGERDPYRWPDGRRRRRFGFYSYYDLSAYIAQGLMAYWQLPVRDDRPTWSGLRQWAVKQTAGAIGKRIHAQWKRLLAMARPDVLAVQRAIFATTFGEAELATHVELYRHKYVVSDIVNYRAAAIAARHVEDLARRQHDVAQIEKARLLRNSKEAQELQALAEGLGFRIQLNTNPANEYREPDFVQQIELMHNWRGLFSPTCEPYRSLNRTLMSLPGGVPSGLVCNLAKVRMQRPIFERLELLALTYSLIKRFAQSNGRHGHLFHYARTSQIKEAMARVAAHTHNDLSPRRARHVRFLIGFLADYPHEHRGNIVGLADKSIRWHREQRETRAAQEAARLGVDTEAARPPIPLPRAEGVRFLTTVGDICREGVDMRHCIASYAARAVDGNCYLFHVEHNGEHSTVAVARDGRDVEAVGPGNQRNGAAAWGRRVLNRWGRGFPEPRALPAGEVL